ncbi:phosphonate ABC transporter ATP-binding protein [Myxacorys almedinensis]|uniref:ATP-binding cassette domain-containing protein n=1 Tax=Myxacorys almedinensis A TaxID=2690445 RepID=A0A8J7ZAC8_9CYAN|nr:phosphonate ABC transporter ATP-binding protein [Myxacorys almedinensis]NDJ18330.1 ATP-binding cassette domain-containing protein [Myxacorys almedinensis A]
MSSAPVISLDRVTFRFGQFVALADVSLHIGMGQRVALVGSSGAGKSTLIRLMNGTLQPTQGEIRAFGQELSQLKPQRLRQIQRQIGTIYQQLHLVDNLRVIHNVNAGHLGRWSFWKALISLVVPLDLPTATNALTQVGILEKLYERTDRLSGGQQQRVAIARVLVQDPLVILADEPISSLDPQLSRDVMELLCQICEPSNRSLVVSLHNIEFALRYCDRIIALRHGRLLFDAPTGSVSNEMIADLYRL